MYHKQQKSDLRLIESLGLFSPEARDSLRKLDASKDKGRVFGGVSHFVLRVRNLSDLISYLGNATLRTLRERATEISYENLSLLTWAEVRSVIWLTPSAHYYKQRRNK
jgi:hypothetical protein